MKMVFCAEGEPACVPDLSAWKLMNWIGNACVVDDDDLGVVPMD